MTTPDRLDSLADASRWTAEAAALLANLGFTLVDRDHPAAGGPADLLVALRERPTLHHFDPEEVTYWVIEADRGRLARMDRETPLRREAAYAWGRITVADRLRVRNQFLTFGGTVRMAAHDAATLILEFASPVPILRWSGHSQGVDPLTAEVGAFFGRMMVPIDFDPGAEALVSAAAPTTLYAAFVSDVHERLSRSEPLREAHAGVAAWAAHESARLALVLPDAWQAGTDLRRNIGLAG